jgi:predicted nucleic acid-binding protein
MRVLVDVNVVLDVLLDRHPHAADSAAVWAAIESGGAKGLLAAHAVSVLHYLIRKEQGDVKARHAMQSILRVFGVAAMDKAVIQGALGMAGPDFEDSVTAAAAAAAGCDWIVTRDPKGFRGSAVRVLTPKAAALLMTAR